MLIEKTLQTREVKCRVIMRAKRLIVECWLTSEPLAEPRKEILVPIDPLNYVEAFANATLFSV